MTATQRVRRIYALLAAEYGDAGAHDRGRLRGDPLDSLIKTVLSQNTSNQNSDRAFAALKARYPTWEAVLAAPVAELEASIRVGGLAGIKAPRIQTMLASIRAAHGALSLRAIEAMDRDQATRYLMAFEGVGRKTAACVLLFALQQPVFPVDTHCLRVGSRLRLLPPNCTADRAHEILDRTAPDDLKLGLHINMVVHGRRRCRPRRPMCSGCPVLRFCSYPAKG